MTGQRYLVWVLISEDSTQLGLCSKLIKKRQEFVYAFWPGFHSSGDKGVSPSPAGARTPCTGEVCFLHSPRQERVDMPFLHWLFIK